MAKKREAGIEILRILSMLMIVMFHFIGHGGLAENAEPLSLSYIVCWLIKSFCFVCVNAYVLISGYFMINSKFKISRILTVWLQTFFYSVIIYAILIAVNIQPFSFSALVKSFLPITTQRYWFVTYYVGMCILSPFLNLALKAMTQNQHKLVLVFGFIVFSVYPTLSYGYNPFGVFNIHSVLAFSYLYCVGAYFRLYETKINKNKFLLSYVVLSMITFASKIVIEFATTAILGHKLGTSVLSNYSSITVVLASVCLFLFFAKTEVKSSIVSKIVLFISPLTFGVYLIHDNLYFREYLWGSLLKTSKLSNSGLLILPIGIGIVSLIFACCIAIEFLRQQLFKLIKVPQLLNFANEKFDKILLKSSKKEAVEQK